MERNLPDSPQELPEDRFILIPSSDHDANDTEAAWNRWRQVIHPAQIEVAQRLYQAHGDAFVIYLDHYYPEQVPLDLDTDFEAVYIGTFDSPEEWAMNVYDNTGWHESLLEALREYEIPVGVVEWNPGYLLSYADTMGYKRHEYGGKYYVFYP